MNTKTKTLEELLDNPPRYLRPVAWLAAWSDNESYETGSAWLEFLDLTGISNHRYGAHVNRPEYCPGYLEADGLADCLKQWANRPQEVEDYVNAIMDADN